MGATYKYFYKVDTSGNPIPGSNFKAKVKPRNSYVRELIPQSQICCDNLEPEVSVGKTTKYYVRLNEQKNPITASLRRFKTKPLNWSSFQEVVAPDCCPIISIAITPITASIEEGGTQAFVLTGTYKSGKVSVITSGATFTSATPTTATITNAGVATGVSAGTSNITATYNGLTSNTAVLTVTEPE